MSIIYATNSNKPINALTTSDGTHTRGAASPLCPTCLRPLLESYELISNHENIGGKNGF